VPPKSKSHSVRLDLPKGGKTHQIEQSPLYRRRRPDFCANAEMRKFEAKGNIEASGQSQREAKVNVKHDRIRKKRKYSAFASIAGLTQAVYGGLRAGAPQLTTRTKFSSSIVQPQTPRDLSRSEFLPVLSFVPLLAEALFGHLRKSVKLEYEIQKRCFWASGAELLLCILIKSLDPFCQPQLHKSQTHLPYSLQRFRRLPTTLQLSAR
jgi:hypothetical protein